MTTGKVLRELTPKARQLLTDAVEHPIPMVDAVWLQDAMAHIAWLESELESCRAAYESVCKAPSQ